MSKPTRFTVVATLVYPQSAQHGLEQVLWYGHTRAAADLALGRLARRWPHYVGWRVVDAGKGRSNGNAPRTA
jgi:hypothetical protein